MTTAEARSDRLFDLLPVVYRMRDAAASNSLRDLLRVIAEQVQVVEDDIARLYDNWFIETADDWVVPYLAELVGWSPVPVPAPRADVANTIRHRRRKGTPAVLEDLAEDLAGWPGRAVEFFRLLRLCQHVNHLRLDRGRTVDVRDLHALELIDTAFDRAAQTVDVRRPSSAHTVGLDNISSVGLFVWRLKSYPVARTPAGLVQGSAYTFDATGLDVPLFTPAASGERGRHPGGVLDVPGPIARHHFEADGRIAPGYYGPGAALTVWAPDWPAHGEGRPVAADKVVPADLGDWNAYAPIPGTVAVDPVRGRLLFPRHHPPRRVYVSYHYGFSAEVGGGEYTRPVSWPRPAPGVDPADPGWYRSADSTRELARAVADWTAEQPPRAVIELTDSDVYRVPVDLALAPGQSLVVRAAVGVRAVLLVPDRRAALAATLADDAELVLDGLLVAGGPVRVAGSGSEGENDDTDDDEAEGDGTETDRTEADRTEADGTHAADGAPVDRPVVLDGREQPRPAEAAPCAGPPRLVVRHCTLFPGFLPQSGCEPDCAPPPALELVDLDGGVATISHSIVGPVVVDGVRHEGDPLRLAIADSIVDATGPQWDAVRGPGESAGYTRLRLARVTVFGQVNVHALERVDDCIFTGVVKAARRGEGCVRFSWVPPGSRTPRRFHCQPDLAVAALGPAADVTQEQADDAVRRAAPRFTSTRYGDPGYAQLSCACPDEVRRGAEDESEMGAFHDLYTPQREAALRLRAAEYTPAAMDVGVITVT
jgi:hypothetical protein